MDQRYQINGFLPWRAPFVLDVIVIAKAPARTVVVESLMYSFPPVSNSDNER